MSTTGTVALNTVAGFACPQALLQSTTKDFRPERAAVAPRQLKSTRKLARYTEISLQRFG
jgi:hypothetical protein